MGTFLRLTGFLWGDNRLDPATGLTERQKRIVKDTWAPLRKDPIGTGAAVMLALFRKHPDTRQIFTAFVDVPLEELPANKKFQSHCRNVVTALSNAIDSLQDPELLEANLVDLAARHKARGQLKEQFEVLKVVLADVLKEALGRKYTVEAAEAWTVTLDTMFSKMYQVYDD